VRFNYLAGHAVANLVEHLSDQAEQLLMAAGLPGYAKGIFPASIPCRVQGNYFPIAITFFIGEVPL
jgi:hypothetical protein